MKRLDGIGSNEQVVDFEEFKEQRTKSNNVGRPGRTANFCTSFSSINKAFAVFVRNNLRVLCLFVIRHVSDQACVASHNNAFWDMGDMTGT